MDIRALGYIGVDVADLDEWVAYAEALGAMATTTTDPLVRIRIDERPARVLVRPAGSAEGLAFVGWELADARALDTAVRELDAAGFSITDSTAGERTTRQVTEMVHLADPSGVRTELYWGPVVDHTPFRSPTGASGFVTGTLGFGHIVLGTPRAAPARAFYTDVLGFRVSDYWRPGGSEVVFLHCNPRHHSLALVPADHTRLYHLMFETRRLDDVGTALDRHRSQRIPISMELGRHPNDEMVSFYSRSPSGFDVEVGWGGRLIDDDTWTVTEITSASLWGHHRPN